MQSSLIFADALIEISQLAIRTGLARSRRSWG
jgi:hypothetical protein